MAPSPAKPGWGASIVKWLGLQLAGQALKFAIGLPFVTGALTALAAYAEGIPLTWGCVAVALVVAATSTSLNQARSFLVSYGIERKFILSQFGAEPAISADKKEGYGIWVIFFNNADIPLEYTVVKVSAQLDGMVASRVSAAGEHIPGCVVSAKSFQRYQIGVVPTGYRKSENLWGEIDITFDYGRPGKLNRTVTKMASIQLVTGANGAVVQCKMRSA